MIGHDVTAALPVLRAEAESLMTVECELQRVDGYTTDPDNGQRVDLWVTYWAGSCKLNTSREAQIVFVAGQNVTVKPLQVGIPHYAPQPVVGERITTPAGTFYITAVEHHSSPVMRRFSAAEHQG